VIRGAAAGHAAARERFASTYEPVVRAYLGARWRHAALHQEIDDATQQVFIECYREGGVLEKATPDRPGGFRAFLYGVLRNVALRAERDRGRNRETQPPTVFDEVGDDTALSVVFDRAWATAVVRDAAALQAQRAADGGAEAERRVEILRLRFQSGLPIRDIASQWSADPVVIHREYARARTEFKAALVEVMAFHHPGSNQDIQSECARLLGLLE
jgi:RNA polymerase sigma-70 factor (ECF subfamily)